MASDYSTGPKVSDENNRSEIDSAAGNGSAPQGNGSSAPDDGDAPPSTRQAAEALQQDPLEAAQSEVLRVRDQLLRTAADFDNFRKRTRREAVDIERRAREDLLRELLPIFDNLERAGQHTDAATDVKALADGIDMVMRQFSDTLAKLGVERVKTVGAPFDPAVHEAIQQLETDAHPPGTIAAEVQAGYRIGDRLIRPAMVVVAKAPRGE